MAIVNYMNEIEDVELKEVEKKLGIYEIERKQETLINGVHVTQIALKGYNYYEITDRLQNKGLHAIIRQGNYITNSSISLFQILNTAVQLEYGANTLLTIFNEKKEERLLTIKYLDEALI